MLWIFDFGVVWGMFVWFLVVVCVLYGSGLLYVFLVFCRLFSDVFMFFLCLFVRDIFVFGWFMHSII